MRREKVMSLDSTDDFDNLFKILDTLERLKLYKAKRTKWR